MRNFISLVGLLSDAIASATVLGRVNNNRRRFQLLFEHEFVVASRKYPGLIKMIVECSIDERFKEFENFLGDVISHSKFE
jgi:hypothetical protein